MTRAEAVTSCVRVQTRDTRPDSRAEQIMINDHYPTASWRKPKYPGAPRLPYRRKTAQDTTVPPTEIFLRHRICPMRPGMRGRPRHHPTALPTPNSPLRSLCTWLSLSGAYCYLQHGYARAPHSAARAQLTPRLCSSHDSHTTHDSGHVHNPLATRSRPRRPVGESPRPTRTRSRVDALPLRPVQHKALRSCAARSAVASCSAKRRDLVAGTAGRPSIALDACTPHWMGGKVMYRSPT